MVRRSSSPSTSRTERPSSTWGCRCRSWRTAACACRSWESLSSIRKDSRSECWVFSCRRRRQRPRRASHPRRVARPRFRANASSGVQIARVLLTRRHKSSVAAPPSSMGWYRKVRRGVLRSSSIRRRAAASPMRVSPVRPRRRRPTAQVDRSASAVAQHSVPMGGWKPASVAVMQPVPAVRPAMRRRRRRRAHAPTPQPVRDRAPSPARTERWWPAHASETLRARAGAPLCVAHRHHAGQGSASIHSPFAARARHAGLACTVPCQINSVT